jgi:alpha-L-fucosidase
MEEKEFRAEYDINNLVDTPRAGYARVDAFFTGKDDAIYAMLPRWPENAVVLKGFTAPSDAKVTLLETGDALQWKASGQELTITMPQALRTKLPVRELYTLKLAGAKEA